jgi:hypothetical protein
MISEGKPFPASYQVRQLDELPASAEVTELRPAGRTGTGGLIFEVDLGGGDSWVGFARPTSIGIRNAVAGLFSTPDPGRLCVITQGAAYLVDVATRRFVLLSLSDPVIFVTSLTDVGLLLLATPWRVLAIGRDGPAWRTERLAIDGLRLDETDGSRLVGVADPDSPEPREFVVDLLNGSHRGGAAVQQQ